MWSIVQTAKQRWPPIKGFASERQNDETVQGHTVRIPKPCLTRSCSGCPGREARKKRKIFYEWKGGDKVFRQVSRLHQKAIRDGGWYGWPRRGGNIQYVSWLFLYVCDNVCYIVKPFPILPKWLFNSISYLLTTAVWPSIIYRAPKSLTTHYVIKSGFQCQVTRVIINSQHNIRP